jgi:hypothetical protein
MLSNETAAKLVLAVQCLGQEAAFGHKPALSSDVADIKDIPIEDLSEEQAQRLTEDAIQQREKLFKEEASWQCK